ncbi:MAG: peroxiredoxin [Actinomycetia bacterium]|nr:peroxiredoxin [Actinomycetes bacterium]MCP4960176.1 peroxiredoxin [Actinomycetes bacterium]
MGVGVGDLAPDFTISGVDRGERGEYTLSDYRGGTVVLVFYPADNSPVCTAQLNSYNNDVGQFADLGATVFAISPQDLDKHEGFSAKQGGFNFPMFADTNKSVGEMYDIVGFLGFYRRSIFVIDADGTISYAHRSVAGVTYRPVDELLDAVKATH